MRTSEKWIISKKKKKKKKMNKMLTYEKQITVLELVAEGHSFRDVSKMTGVSRGAVSTLVKRGKPLRSSLADIEIQAKVNRQQNYGKTLCLDCGGPLPCPSCALKRKIKSGTMGKEPAPYEVIPLDLDDTIVLEHSGLTVKQAADVIKEGWTETERVSRGKLSLDLSFAISRVVSLGLAHRNFTTALESL